MKIIANPEFSSRTTLNLGGRGIAEAWLEFDNDWDELSNFLEKEGGRPLAFGAGSNILPASGNLPVILIRIGQEKNITLVRESEKEVLLRVNAGMYLTGLFNYIQKIGLSGLEALTGIPGTVGGAVSMNAGSFQTEFKDVVKRIQLWTPKQGLFWLDTRDVCFGYRCFFPKTRNSFYLIKQVEIALMKDSKKNIKEAMKRYYQEKKARQPILTKTCGCVFKNPDESRSAGRLLEESGFKGTCLGNMAFSDRHANFLINLGQGTSQEAFCLIEQAKEKVEKLFFVDLQMEVKVIT